MSEVAYLDASALVKLSIEEEHSTALRRASHGWRRHASSRLAVTEVLRVVRRFDVAAEPVARSVLSRVALVVADDGILFAAAHLDPPALRSLDAIHLATALRLRDSLAAFVSYDERQREAAEALGLPVSSPS